jgi:hypothetical protein
LKGNVTGIITWVAGTGTAGSSGDGGLATDAQPNLPGGVGGDRRWPVPIADMGNNELR